MSNILFATGIECSYPKVEGGRRRDQLAETKHYEFWRDDLRLCAEVGARTVRYGIPYYVMHRGPHDYNWEFTDEVLPVLRELGLTPIVDLCHFGLPDWAGDFQNTDWPELFAGFADAFAARYPWVRFYTPVNEILVCAKFSGKMGIWNEQLTSDSAMVRAHANMCKATLLSIERIRARRSDAVFFQSEAAEAFFAESPQADERVRQLSEMRFLTFDFLYGHPPDGEMLTFLFDNGLDTKGFQWFMQHGRSAARSCVMGMDYYKANERAVRPDGSEEPIGPVLGWQAIAAEYYQRYRRPMMLTETNVLDAEEAPRWLWNTWHNVQSLRKSGVPVLGYTWYSLIDQVDWDIQLRAIKGNVNPNGMFTLARTPHPVAQAFKDLARNYGDRPLLEDFPSASLETVSGRTSGEASIHRTPEADEPPAVFTPDDVTALPPDRPPTENAPASEKASLLFERS